MTVVSKVASGDTFGNTLAEPTPTRPLVTEGPWSKFAPVYFINTVVAQHIS